MGGVGRFRAHFGSGRGQTAPVPSERRVNPLGRPLGRWGYENRIEDWVAQECGIRVEVIKRTPGRNGWELLPKRWVAERTFAWLGWWRGLAKE